MRLSEIFISSNNPGGKLFMKTISNNIRIGGIVLTLSGILFLVLEFISASAWKNPAYNYATYWMSDLGVPIETGVAKHIVNSPWYALMNLNFVSFGVLLIVGFLLIASLFEKKKAFRMTILTFIYAFGPIIIGTFPGYEFSLQFMHPIGAMFTIIGGSLHAITTGRYLGRILNSRMYQAISIVLAIIAATGFVITLTQSYPDNIQGIIERTCIYPVIIWPVITGAMLLTKSGRIQVA